MVAAAALSEPCRGPNRYAGQPPAAAAAGDAGATTTIVASAKRRTASGMTALLCNHLANAGFGAMSRTPPLLDQDDHLTLTTLVIRNKTCAKPTGHTQHLQQVEGISPPTRGPTVQSCLGSWSKVVPNGGGCSAQR